MVSVRITRQSAPFIERACAAIPESLAEAELFGKEKGAFKQQPYSAGRPQRT